MPSFGALANIAAQGKAGTLPPPPPPPPPAPAIVDVAHAIAQKKIDKVLPGPPKPASNFPPGFIKEAGKELVGPIAKIVANTPLAPAVTIAGNLLQGKTDEALASVKDLAKETAHALINKAIAASPIGDIPIVNDVVKNVATSMVDSVISGNGNAGNRAVDAASATLIKAGTSLGTGDAPTAATVVPPPPAPPPAVLVGDAPPSQQATVAAIANVLNPPPDLTAKAAWHAWASQAHTVGGTIGIYTK